MSDDRGGGGSLKAATASSTTPSGSQSWSSRPARPRPSLGIPSNSAQQSGFNFSGTHNCFEKRKIIEVIFESGRYSNNFNLL